MNDERNAYYDHEPIYRRLRESGESTWDASQPLPNDDSFADLRDFIASEFIPEPGLALELGCGGGQGSLLLAAADWRVACSDYAPSAVGMANDNACAAGAPVWGFVSDATRPLPIRERACDLVIENHVFHCIVDPAHRRQFLASIFDALKPGGIHFGANMIVGENLDYEKTGIDRTTRIAVNGSRYLARPEELEAEYISAGFEILRFEVKPPGPDEITGGDAIVYSRRPAPK